MANTRKSSKPKFKVGDEVVIAYNKGAPGFIRIGGGFVVVERDVRRRAADPRPNRYRVQRINNAKPGTEGWVYEDDLLTVAEGREAGIL